MNSVSPVTNNIIKRSVVKWSYRSSVPFLDCYLESRVMGLNTNTRAELVIRATPNNTATHTSHATDTNAGQTSSRYTVKRPPPLDCLIGSHYVGAIIIIQGFFTGLRRARCGPGSGSDPDCGPRERDRERGERRVAILSIDRKFRCTTESGSCREL